MTKNNQEVRFLQLYYTKVSSSLDSPVVFFIYFLVCNYLCLDISQIVRLVWVSITVLLYLQSCSRPRLTRCNQAEALLLPMVAFSKLSYFKLFFISQPISMLLGLAHGFSVLRSAAMPAREDSLEVVKFSNKNLAVYCIPVDCNKTSFNFSANFLRYAYYFSCLLHLSFTTDEYVESLIYNRWISTATRVFSHGYAIKCSGYFFYFIIFCLPWSSWWINTCYGEFHFRLLNLLDQLARCSLTTVCEELKLNNQYLF